MAAEIDEFFMRRAIALAKHGSGKVSPNPLVGCVIVNDGAIVAEGWHAQYGEAHAEQMALASVSSVPENSTLYVTLEPCCHVGNTPACAPSVVRSGIKRVVIGCTDPNPLVSGRGIQMMVDAGIEVHTGILQSECAWLARFFLKHISTAQPYVVGKIAQSADGSIAAADGTSKWLTNSTARKMVHRMRAEIDAVMVGVGTVIADNPSLTVREVEGRNPARIVIDPQLRTPPSARIFSEAQQSVCMVVCDESANSHTKSFFSNAGWDVIEVASVGGQLDMRKALNTLGSKNLTSVLCEGGGRTMSALIQASLLDELHVFTAPLLLGRGLGWTPSFSLNPETAIRFNTYSSEVISGDIHTVLLPTRNVS